MKVTKEYLKKVIKESIKEAQSAPGGDGSFLVAYEQDGEISSFVSERIAGVQYPKFFTSQQEAQKVANEEEDNISDTYSNTMGVYKLKRVSAHEDALLGTMGALDAASKGAPRRK